MSELGVQQGNPLRCALFARVTVNHPCLVELAQRPGDPVVLVTVYADKNFFLGSVQAVNKAFSDFKAILQGANLQLNTSESHLHHQTLCTPITGMMGNSGALVAQAPISLSGFHDKLLFRLDGGDTIPLAHEGLQIFGCPAGTEQFCTSHLDL